jgi:hypothetical protein
MVPLFAAKAKGLPLPNLVEGPVKANSPTDGSSEVPTLEREIDLPAAEASASPKVILQAAVDPDFCSNHPAQAAAFICSGCNGSFCRSCPRSYGGNVKICPNCGAMCRSVKEVRESSAAVDRKAAAIAEGFGFADFVKALSHPLRFKFSLIVGAIMFTAFSVGRSSSVIGGIEMIVASTFCSLLGNMLTFGVLANTLDNFSRGDLDENFMPAFEDFSMGDDVVHPFVLSAGAYISSFGAFAVVALIGFYMVSSAVDSKMNTLQADIEKIPGTQFYTAKDTVKQSDEVRNLLAETQSQNAERLKMQNDIANGNTNATAVDDESAEQEQLWREASEQRKAGIE